VHLDETGANEPLERTASPRAFPAFEIGAEPPIGPLVNVPAVIDKSLLGHDEVVCAGGDHQHSLLLDRLQLARVSDATVAEISRP
jgi:prolyl-tRNA editing enzyme YbaK/EbsC (Cys-tRNA(Pro) deacylase)